MTTLQGFPLLTQRTAITGDGQSSEDAAFECVTTCILAALMYLLGIRQMDGQWNPDAIKDAVYGQGYVGGTAASRYVDSCRAHGVRLWNVRAMPALLVAAIHAQLAAGKPVLVTVPDSYVPASYGWTHVLAAYADAPGQITMLDPWPGRPITKSDQEWTNLLLDNEIWILELEEESMQPLTIDMPEVAKLFRQNDERHWQSRATGRILQFALLDDYRANGLASLTYLGDVQSPELYQPNGDVVQFYAHGARLWVKATGKVVPFDVFSAAGVAILKKILTVPTPAPEAPQEHAFVLQVVEQGAALIGKKLV